ncbi:MAG: LysM peptidoglycan-binding domain-containing protein [Treponema sp.]|nr:LysM peptidoglycan-binding domain-containing protein [Treponema sp.]
MLCKGLCLLMLAVGPASGLWAEPVPEAMLQYDAETYAAPEPDLAPADLGFSYHTTMQGNVRPVRSERGDFNPSLFPGRTPPAPPPSAILVPEHLDRPLTRYYIRRYTSPNGVAWLHSVMRNGHTYIPFVRNEIESRGLPPELLFVPFIESDYIGTALSRSGAMGIWQFMMNSIAPFGLRVTDMLDERRDFRRSTVAALRKLEGHYQNFGCWAMAFAAYNMGPNGLRRATVRAGTTDYWELAERREISRETTNFVPRIVATAYVLANARRYGIDWWPTGIEWTTVTPGRQVSLDLIASQTGTDRNVLRRLNLELLHGITPADPLHEIVVPASQADAITYLLAREDMVLVRYHRYRIQPGDTLYALSRHYRVSVATIVQHNPAIRNRHLRPGETIIIPVLTEVEPFSREPVTLSRPFDGTHIVSQGDTLWSLARMYNVNPQELAVANNMELNQILSIGRALRVPIIEE